MMYLSAPTMLGYRVAFTCKSPSSAISFLFRTLRIPIGLEFVILVLLRSSGLLFFHGKAISLPINFNFKKILQSSRFLI